MNFLISCTSKMIIQERQNPHSQEAKQVNIEVSRYYWCIHKDMPARYSQEDAGNEFLPPLKLQNHQSPLFISHIDSLPSPKDQIRTRCFSLPHPIPRSNPSKLHQKQNYIRALCIETRDPSPTTIVKGKNQKTPF